MTCLRKHGAPRSDVEATVKLRMLLVLACTLLAVSACIVEPFGGRGGGGGGGYYRGGHDDGHRVWR